MITKLAHATSKSSSLDDIIMNNKKPNILNKCRYKLLIHSEVE